MDWNRLVSTRLVTQVQRHRPTLMTAG